MINLSSNSLSKEDCVLEIPELKYDKTELQKIYEQVKDFARVKYLPWVETKRDFKKVEESKSTIIQYNDHEIRNPLEFGKGVNLLEFDYIKDLANQFSFVHPIHPGNVTMILYKENFMFKPHVDGYANAVVMFPIFSSKELAPINFYHRTGMTYESYKEYPDVTDYDVIYTHHYSDKHATIFNSHVIHSIKTTTGFQVKLKFNVNEPFDSIRTKYRNNRLVSML